MESKADINNIRFLKTQLTEREFKDFVELMKKGFTAKVICDGNVTIEYHDANGNLAYSFTIDRDSKVNGVFNITLSKFCVKLLDGLLKDTTFIKLLRKSLDVSLYAKYAYLWNKHCSIRYDYPKKEPEFKAMKLVPKRRAI